MNKWFSTRDPWLSLVELARGALFALDSQPLSLTMPEMVLGQEMSGLGGSRNQRRMSCAKQGFMNKKFPILEYDSTRIAFIEPSKVIAPLDMPEFCVICFFKDAIDKVVTEHNAKVLVTDYWEDGPHPIYEIQYCDKRLAFFHPGVGAPLAAGLLEKVIAYGCRKFMVCGGCGVLDKHMTVGSFLVVSSAVRDEGVSYHYLPPSREVFAQDLAVEALTNTLSNMSIPHHIGKTWTTDAPFRETPGRIAMRKNEGCLAVEMESASMLAVAQFRGVTLGQILYGGDDLSCVEWDERSWQLRAAIREKLFWLCADAVLTV